ncbi:hypothetical protein MKW92_016018, partial [Papaver armeniacum]
VTLGTIACNVGLMVLEPSMIGEPADPFATPLEILPKCTGGVIDSILFGEC